MFNLGYYSGFAGGAYACGRCHTTGWSYGDKGADELTGGYGKDTFYVDKYDTITDFEKGVDHIVKPHDYMW